MNARQECCGGRVPSAATPPKQRRGRVLAGFSLLEVMISGTMMLAGIAGMMSAYTTLSIHYAHQRHMTHGIHLAEAELEGLLVRFADDALLAPGLHPSVARYDATGNRVGSGGTYLVDVRVVSHPVIPGFRRVTVIVRWQERGREASVQLTTERT